MIVAGDHAELNEHLNAYLDGELDAALQERVAAHLASCEHCRRDLAQLSATRQALAALSPLRAPRPFTVTAPARPARAPWLERLLPWGWRLGALASAACLIVAVLSALPGAPAQSSLSSVDVRVGSAERTTSAAEARPGPAGASPATGSAALRAPQAQSQPAAPASAGVAADKASGAAAGAAPAASPPAAAAPAQGTTVGAATARDNAVQSVASAQSGRPESASVAPEEARPAPAAAVAFSPSSRATPYAAAAAWLAGAVVLAVLSAIAFSVTRR